MKGLIELMFTMHADNCLRGFYC